MSCKVIFRTLFVILLVFGVLIVVQTYQDIKKGVVFASSVNAKMEEAFNTLYPDPTLSFLGTKSPDYQKTVGKWAELKVAFVSGEENFFSREYATVYELLDAAARGRFAMFEAICKIKPQKGCLEY